MKVLKTLLIVILIASVSIAGIASFYFFSIYKSAKAVDVNFQNNLDKFVFLDFFDRENNRVELVEKEFAKKEDIPVHVFLAFTSKEDRRFYAHNGVDYRGIMRAFYVNAKNRATLQGGSTITQQLAKNLVLSQEKKLSRKVSEVAVAKNIESMYEKDEILTMYLNVIYFGENTFGIYDASRLYFGKTPGELTISEGAMLAGIVASPENFNPIKNPEVAKEKRDLVLFLMHKEGCISDEEYSTATKEDLVCNITKEDSVNYDYFNHTLREASQILGVSQRELCEKNYRIFTYIDQKKQQLLHAQGTNLPSCDGVLIALDNETRSVLGVFESRHRETLQKRSPASLVKPLLVYAPALEENVIFENSIITDEKTDFGGYCPQNYLDIYHGEITAKTALAKSLNVPSVKILESLSVYKAKNYASMLNMPLAKEDVGLSIALGGLFEGVSPEEISNSYMCLANGGEYQQASYVREIQDENGNIIYSRELHPHRVFGDDTAYIVTDMLKECTKSGTAKTIGNVSPYIASKTGTNGDKNGNLDAYYCGYSRGETFFCWLGNSDFSYMPLDVKGSSFPTEIASKFFATTAEFADFEKPESVCELLYDYSEYKQNKKLLQATSDTPKKNIASTIIAKRFYPSQKSLKYSYPQAISPKVMQSGDYLEISFLSQDFAKYEIFDLQTSALVAEVDGNGKSCEIVLPASGVYAEFQIVAYNKESGKKGEIFNTKKLYLEKNFLPNIDKDKEESENSEKQNEGRTENKDVPLSDSDILDFFSFSGFSLE